MTNEINTSRFKAWEITQLSKKKKRKKKGGFSLKSISLKTHLVLLPNH